MTLKVSRFKRYRYSRLWLTEHFFKSRKTLTEKRKALSENIADEIPSGNHFIPVEEIEDLSIKEFIKKYRNTSTPVVLKKAATSWGFFQKWNPEYFAKKYPEDPILIFEAAIEDRMATKEKSYETTSLKSFVDKMNNGGKDYIRFLPMLDSHPELLEDLNTKWLDAVANKNAKSKKFQFFMGGKNTSTSMHGAIGSNLFIQIYGRKQWWIYSNKNTPLIQPILERSVFFRSEVDACEPTGPFEKGEGWTTVLEPGDILYNPPFYWHQAKNLGTNIGVGFRWFSLLPILKVSPTQFLLTVTASNPSIKDAKRLDGNFAKVYSEMLKVKKKKD